MLADDRGQSNKRPAVVNLRKGGGSPHLSLIRHATPCERKMISGPRMGNNRSRFFFFELNAVNWISFQDGIGETTLLKHTYKSIERRRRCKKISRYNNYFYEPHLGIVFYFCFIESRCCSQFLDNRIFTNCYVQKFSGLKNLFFFVCKINYIYIYKDAMEIIYFATISNYILLQTYLHLN